MTTDQAQVENIPGIKTGDVNDKRSEPVLKHISPNKICHYANHNCRESFDRDTPEWKAFLDNLRHSGVVVPICLNREEDGDLWLIAGARRTAAAKELNLELVPVVIYHNLSEAERQFVAFNENFGRLDLTPLEEGQSVVKILEAYKGDMQAVSLSLGRSESWVRRRAKLCDLSPLWQKNFLDTDSLIHNFTAGHLSLVSRFPVDTQDAMLECFNYDELPTIKELEKGLNEFLHLLCSAPFPLDKKVGKIAACNVCPKRSSASPGLFDAIDGEEPGKGDKCLDAVCWQTKVDNILLGKIKSFNNKHKNYRLISDNRYQTSDVIKTKYNMKLLAEYEFKVIKKAIKGRAHHPALWVQGPKTGQECLIKITEQNYQRDTRLAKEKAKAEKATPEYKAKAKEERLAKKRNAWMLRIIIDRIEGQDAGQLDRFHPSSDMLLRLLAVVYCAECSCSHNLDEYFYEIEKGSRDELNQSVWGHVKDYILSALKSKEGGLTENKLLLQKGLGIDLEALKRDAIEAIPTPKSRK